MLVKIIFMVGIAKIRHCDEFLGVHGTFNIWYSCYNTHNHVAYRIYVKMQEWQY